MVTKRKNHMKNFEEVYFIVERALELAFKGDFVLKFYPYLEGEGVKKKQIKEEKVEELPEPPKELSPEEKKLVDSMSKIMDNIEEDDAGTT